MCACVCVSLPTPSTNTRYECTRLTIIGRIFPPSFPTYSVPALLAVAVNYIFFCSGETGVSCMIKDLVINEHNINLRVSTKKWPHARKRRAGDFLLLHVVTTPAHAHPQLSALLRPLFFILVRDAALPSKPFAHFWGIPTWR